MTLSERGRQEMSENSVIVYCNDENGELKKK